MSIGRYKTKPTEDRTKGSRIESWNLELLCVKGVIFPHGGTYTARSRTRKVLKALPCVRVRITSTETSRLFRKPRLIFRSARFSTISLTRRLNARGFHDAPPLLCESTSSRSEVGHELARFHPAPSQFVVSRLHGPRCFAVDSIDCSLQPSLH